MTRWLYPALLPGLLLAIAANSATATRAGELSPDASAVVEGNNTFALDLYRELATDKGNLFFSPYSISTALCMTYAGARGHTAEQMAATMHFGVPPDFLHPAFGSLINEINGAGRPRKYQLHTANRLWGQKDYGFLPKFFKVTETNYGAGLKEVDFIGAREQARKAINAWVEEQTRNKIKELIKPGILTVDTRLVLTNAISFKAAWLQPFSKKSTATGDFHVSADKKVKVPLMHGGVRTSYFKGDGFEALNLPYESNYLSMVIFLPKAGGLADFEKRLTAANVRGWLRKLSPHKVAVTLPKFKVTAEFMLNDVLSRMGMPLAFDARKADFSGMTTRHKLYISHVIHKTFVDVNEKGTEAVGSTAVAVSLGGKPPPATFRADRPFVFLIRDNRTGTILFTGRLVDPS
jgi:serpin B